jgi:hypothetical protein
MSTGFEGIALEFQQNANQIAEQQVKALEDIARRLEEIGRGLSALGPLAQRIEELIDHLPEPPDEHATRYDR